MEHANDDIFNIRYNEKANKLEMGENKKSSKILKAISKNKFIIGVSIAFIFFSCLNLLLIYKFYKILEIFA